MGRLGDLLFRRSAVGLLRGAASFFGFLRTRIALGVQLEALEGGLKWLEVAEVLWDLGLWDSGTSLCTWYTLL